MFYFYIYIILVKIVLFIAHILTISLYSLLNYDLINLIPKLVSFYLVAFAFTWEAFL